MKRWRYIAAIAICACSAVASTVAAQEKDSPEEPQRFRNLFVVKQMVLLKTFTANTLYTIQLLTSEQTKQVEQMVAEQARAEQRMSSIEKLLT